MSINKKRFNIYTICMIALLTAMMVLLKRTIAIETPYFKFNFASLPIMLAAMLFGPVEGMVVGLLGEFIAQITGPYGLAPTTVLYVAPAAIRGVVVGLGAVWCRRTGKRIESRPVACYAICVAIEQHREHLAGERDVPHRVYGACPLPARTVCHRNCHRCHCYHCLYPSGARPAPQRRCEIH